MTGFEYVAAVARAVPLVKRGWDALLKDQPDYGKFWKAFKTALDADTNVDEDAVERKCRLEPEFIGAARGLIVGDGEARDRLREHFESFDFLADAAYDERTVVLERVLRRAEEAAARAARDDAELAVAQRRLTEETTRASTESLSADIEKVGIEHEEGRAALTEQILDKFEEQSDAMQALEERVNARIDRATGLRGLGDEPGSPTGVALDTSEIVEESSVELMATLRVEDASAADELDRLLRDHGLLGLLRAIREGRGPGSEAGMVAAARLAAKEAHYGEAEAAFLRAADLAADDHSRARQFVRAASMARAVGAKERTEQLVARAKALDAEHPAVALVEARQADDPDAMLDRVAAIQPENDGDRALLHVTRGQARLALDDLDAARTELVLAQQAESDNLAVRELGAMLSFAAGQRELSEGGSYQALAQSAGEEFEKLAVELDKQQRPDESAHLTARAVEAFAVGGEIEKAEKLVADVRSPERFSIEARMALGQAALAARRPDFVERFISADADTEAARLLRADAVVMGDASSEDRLAAVDELLALLESDAAHIRDAAASAALVGAAFHAEVPWSNRASEVLRDAKPSAEAVLRSHRLWTEGKREEADAPLLAYADNPQALRQLRDFAAQREEWEKARDRAGDLARISGAPDDLLAYADTLRRSGDLVEALDRFLALARDSRVAADVRAAAYAGAIEIRAGESDYTAMREVAEEWHTNLPESPDGAWNLLFALARLARHEQAYELYRDAALDVNTPSRALLAAEILSRAAPPDEAVLRIGELSDQCDGAEEGLEALIIQTSLRGGSEDAAFSEAAGRRIQEAYRAFPERFPDSEAIQMIEVPEDPEKLAEFLIELSGDHIAPQREANERLIQGRLPVNALAAVAPGKGVLETWAALRRLPLGFAVEEQDERDRQAARAALGAAAVWDPSSLFIVGGLGLGFAGRIRNALPGSVITNECLMDVDLSASTPGGDAGESMHDPETGEWLGVRQRGADEVERDKRIFDGCLALAHTLDVRPGRVEEADERLRDLAESATAREWQILFTAVSLAAISGRPLFSDDRWIREMARFFGVPAFGTIALLDALDEAGVMTPVERRAARLRLVGSGAWGVSASGAELIELGRRSDWALSKYLGLAIQDRAAWRGRPANHAGAVIEFLQAVYDHQPDSFPLWAQRVVDAADESFEGFAVQPMHLLVALACWGLDPAAPLMDDDCFHRFVSELQRLPSWLESSGEDPVVGAILLLMNFHRGQPEAVRTAAFLRMTRRFRSIDSVRAWLEFVA